MAYLPNVEEFKELAYRLRDLLKKERSKEDVGKYISLGALAKIKSVDRLIIVGDLHGDYSSLIKILSETGLKSKIPENTVVVFLGDYIDRGRESPHVIYEVFKLKLREPNSVVLLRGNHEGPPELPVYPHDFPMHLSHVYRERWEEVYDSITSCFNYFYACAILEGSLFIVHGGVPTETRKLEDLINANKDIALLEELLWNDPMDEIGRAPSPRGAGYLFGPDVTEAFLKAVKAKVVIRSHEPCNEGYEVLHNGKLITIFSRKGFPYFNSHGAYLDVHKPIDVENAYQIADKYVRRL
ncbi:MAG: metallophosphoesterase family protein [Candidatus Nezhaarchaeales archaeon]